MKKSINFISLTILGISIIGAAYAGGPPTIYPTTTTSSSMSPNETMEIKGRLIIGNATGAPDSLDMMLMRGNDGRIKERPLPPGMELPGGGGSPGAGAWQLNGNTNTVHTNFNVGINTNSATVDLEVVGQMRVTDILTVGQASIVLDGTVDNNGPVNSIFTNNGDLFIQTQNTYNTIIGTRSTSNVGIGLINPQKKLHIRTSHIASSDTHHGIRIEDITGSSFANPKFSAWDFEPNYFNNQAVLQIGTPGNPLFSITAGGNVGIGTTSPSERVTIKSVNNAVNFGIERSSNTNNVFAVVETAAGAGRSYIYDANGNLDILLATDGNVYFNNSGNVGIGTTNPDAVLEVKHPAAASQKIAKFGDDEDRSIFMVSKLSGFGYSDLSKPNDVGIFWNDHSGSPGTGVTAGLVIAPWNSNSSGIRITSEGKVGIGRTSPGAKLDVNGSVLISGNVGIGVIPLQFSQYKLEVAGSIRACRVRVENTWCDFVFDSDYNRPALKEKGIFYDTKGHLMYLPSAEEIEENGLDVGGTIKGIAQNTEENSLDLVDHDVRIEDLESDVDEKDKEIKLLKKENKTLRKKQNQIEKRLKKLENR